MPNDTLTTGPLDVQHVRDRLRSPDSAARILQVAAAVLVAVGGYVHLDLYTSGGYSAIPVVGPMFLANVIASALVAVAVLARPSVLVHVAGLAVSVGSLLALGAAHTVGIAGFTEAALGPDQIATIASEGAAAVAFGWLLVRTRA